MGMGLERGIRGLTIVDIDGLAAEVMEVLVASGRVVDEALPVMVLVVAVAAVAEDLGFIVALIEVFGFTEVVTGPDGSAVEGTVELFFTGADTSTFSFSFTPPVCLPFPFTASTCFPLPLFAPPSNITVLAGPRAEAGADGRVGKALALPFPFASLLFLFSSLCLSNSSHSSSVSASGHIPFFDPSAPSSSSSHSSKIGLPLSLAADVNPPVTPNHLPVVHPILTSECTCVHFADVGSPFA